MNMIEQDIQKELSDIERCEDVKIIFAIESGSRAWGFPSADSDYDIRFVYAHRPDWYISVYEGRDVIERPISGLLDISGWDIKKALHLLRKSNPAMMEWQASPIKYREHPTAYAELQTLSRQAFLPLASCHHYKSMMKEHQKRAEGSDQVKYKIYLYALRALLASMWVIRYKTQPPVLFPELVNEFLPDGSIRNIIDELVKIKMSASETDTVARVPELDHFMDTEIAKVELALPEPVEGISKQQCNEALRSILDICWN